MIYIDVAIRLARSRGFTAYRMPINPAWLCIDRADGTPAGRTMITDDQISRHALDQITS
jgi:hypothetical protein